MQHSLDDPSLGRSQLNISLDFDGVNLGIISDVSALQSSSFTRFSIAGIDFK